MTGVSAFELLTCYAAVSCYTNGFFSKNSNYQETSQSYIYARRSTHVLEWSGQNSKLVSFMESRALLMRPTHNFSVEFHVGHEHRDKGSEQDIYLSAIILGLGGGLNFKGMSALSWTIWPLSPST